MSSATCMASTGGFAAGPGPGRLQSPTRSVICPGDLVDRGRDNEQMLDLLEQPWFHSVLGNHEMMLLDALTQPEVARLHVRNGGAWFAALSPRQQQQLAERIRRHCPLAQTVETGLGPVGMLHATAPSDWQVVQEVPLEPDHWDELLWDREDYRDARQSPQLVTPVHHVAYTVHGHVSCAAACRISNRCWIDTLYRGGDISLLALDQLPSLPAPSTVA